MSIRVSHAYGDHIAVAVPDGTEILRYVYRPDPDAFEARAAIMSYPTCTTRTKRLSEGML